MIMAMQRSGTTALFETLSTAPSLVSHEESADSAIYLDYFLRPESETRDVIRSARSSVLLKPVRETERRSLVSVMDEYAGYDLQILWLYRDPVNVAHSYGELGWSDVTSVALEWVARNRMAIELPVTYHNKLTVLRYESLISDPRALKFVNRKLGIRACSTLRRDSQAGRTRMPSVTQAQVDAITASTLQDLDRLQIAGRDTGRVAKWKASYRRFTERLGRRMAPTSMPSWLDELPESNDGLTVPNFEAERFRLEPYQCLRRWRECRSYHYGRFGNVWLLSGYDEVSRALDDSSRFAYQTSRLLKESGDADRERFREAIALAAIPTSTDRIISSLEKMACEEIRRHTEGGRFDLAQLSQIAIASMLYQLLGVSSDSPDGFFERTNRGETIARLSSSFLPGGWLSTVGKHASLTNWELDRFLRIGGYFHYVIAMFATSAVHFLLGVPGLLDEIRRDPDRFSAVYTELIRMAYPILAVERWTTVDVEAAGSIIPAHHLVYLAIGAANRDPAVFERSDEFVAARLSPTSSKVLKGYSNISYAFSQWEDLGHLVCLAFLKVLLTACPPLEPVRPMGETVFTWTHCRGAFREILQIPVIRYLKTLDLKFGTT